MQKAIGRYDGGNRSSLLEVHTLPGDNVFLHAMEKLSSTRRRGERTKATRSLDR